MPSATEKIAAKLAARQVAQEEPVEAVEVEDEVDEVEELEDEAEAEEDGGSGDEDEEEEEEAKPTIAERAAAARTKKGFKPAQTEADIKAKQTADRAAAKAASVAKATAPARPAPKATAKGQAGTGPGKKSPSAAQLAARANFAAMSKARAAERAAEKEAPAPAKAAKGTVVKRSAIGGNQKNVTPAKATAKVSPPTKAKAAPAKEKAPASDIKAKILARWAKGATRREIMDEFGLSYAAVFFHTKDVPGTGLNAKRGSIFVDSELDENGKKLRGGKTQEVSRSEAMRRMYLSGVSVGDIGRAFEVRYQIAYTAVRSLMGSSEAEEE